MKTVLLLTAILTISMAYYYYRACNPQQQVVTDPAGECWPTADYDSCTYYPVAILRRT